MTEELEQWMARFAVEQGPKLIDVGSAVVDARDIVAVLAIYAEDWHKVLESGEKVAFPSYAKSQVWMKQGGFLVSESRDEIVTRWRQALGGLPEPIGSSSATAEPG